MSIRDKQLIDRYLLWNLVTPTRILEWTDILLASVFVRDLYCEMTEVVQGVKYET